MIGLAPHTQFLYSLLRRANAPNISFETLNGGQFMLSTQLIMPYYLVILFYQCGTTVFRKLPPLNLLHQTKPTTPNYTYCTKLHQTTSTAPTCSYTYCTKLHLLHQLLVWFYDRINVNFSLDSINPCFLFVMVIKDKL